MRPMRAHRCRSCGSEFCSRNKLFAHIREEGHDDGKQQHDTPAQPTPRIYDRSPWRLPVFEDSGLAARIERIDLFGDGTAYVLRNVLSPTECERYITAATEIGMTSVQAHGYERRVRMCNRVAASSAPLAALLFDRVAPFLAHEVDLSSPDFSTRPKGLPADRTRAVWRPHGLNEMFRICSYDPGGHFAPHLDGGYVRLPSDASLQTFMLYLNDDFVGGSTRFFDDTQAAYRTPDPSKVRHTYVPRRGDALVFNSELMHDGEALRAGRKFIMRSEVMYTWQRTQAEAALGHLFDALGGSGAVSGVEETVAAVREGRAATLLVSDGVVREGEVAWLCEQSDLGRAELVAVPPTALAGAGKQFLVGLEGVGALLSPDAPPPLCASASTCGVDGGDAVGSGHGMGTATRSNSISASPDRGAGTWPWAWG